MKNYLKMFAAVLALVLLPSLAFGQQFTLTQTTLTADVGLSSTTWQLGSVTGIVGQGNGPGTGTSVYIDRELASVISVNTSAKTVTVLRNGGQASAHKASTMVLFGNPNAFINGADPVGTCAVASVPAQPTINVRTGNQWLCSSVTLTWVPGFGNPGNSASPITPTTLVASTAGLVTPTGPLFHINGTSAITGFNIPTGCNASVRGACAFTVIPDAAFTWTTANNIAVAGTAVANLVIIFTWDPVSSKFVQMQSK